MCSNSNIPCGCGCSGTGLGLTATQKRPIKAGTEYNQYFNLGELAQKETNLKMGDQKDTLAVMESWTKKHQHQTKRIAQQLKGGQLINTLSNLWHFLYNHVQYTLDANGVEQLRTPLRVWTDRAHGVDCDCYSIFISSVLRNLGIPHAFRMAKYSGDWQHVYVVVPKDGNETSLHTRPNYYVIDPVKDRFNDEQPFTAKFDRMQKIQITGLSGMGETNTCQASTAALQYEDVAAIEREGNFVTSKLLEGAGISYQRATNEAGEPIITFKTADGGELNAPTVISKEMAVQIQTMVSATEAQPTEPQQATAGIGNGWMVALLALAGGIWFFSATAPPTKGLSGTVTNSPKRTKRKTLTKTKTINI